VIGVLSRCQGRNFITLQKQRQPSCWNQIDEGHDAQAIGGRASAGTFNNRNADGTKSVSAPTTVTEVVDDEATITLSYFYKRHENSTRTHRDLAAAAIAAVRRA
jgi:hypothetical protein